MKILLAAKHAPEGRKPIGGVQSWCRTVAAELRRRGHQADTWGPEQTLPRERFDLGIMANRQSTSSAVPLCDQIINICHGIIPAEKPVVGDGVVMFTSEGVRDHWGVFGEIIRQPIDLDFWRPFGVERHYLTRFSYRGHLEYIRYFAKPMGLEYVHLRNSPPEKVRDVLNRSGVVIASGRALLEAMACGVPVVLCDHRSAYQKALLDPDIIGAMQRNYSGRGGINPSIERVKEEIHKAIERGNMRAHVKQHHDVSRIVDQLLGAV